MEGVFLIVAPEGGYMSRSPPPPRAKENFDLDREGLVAVVAIVVAGVEACLGFESVSAVQLISSSPSERNSSSAREGGANLAVTIGTATSCKCKRKQ